MDGHLNGSGRSLARQLLLPSTHLHMYCNRMGVCVLLVRSCDGGTVCILDFLVDDQLW